jgi:two-component system, cell cycle response regulator
VVNKKLVMIVDDDWMNREVIEAYLLNAEYEVINAHSGEQALELTARQLPDVVLLDLRMQGMGGLEVCRRLKAQPHTQHIPILIVSALNSENEKIQAVAAGADDFIPKPLDAPIMLNRLKSFARIKTLVDALQQHENRLRTVLARHVNPEVASAILNEYNTPLEN